VIFDHPYNAEYALLAGWADAADLGRRQFVRARWPL